VSGGPAQNFKATGIQKRPWPNTKAAADGSRRLNLGVATL